MLTLTIPELSFTIIKRVPKSDPKATEKALDAIEGRLDGAKFREIFPFLPADNDPCLSDFMGLEFSKLDGAKRLSMFYCDPYVSNQKGSVENANGQLRRYFPKGSSVDKLSDSTIAEINSQII